MKEKIALALKTKYQHFGLSNEAIDRIAVAKEKTVTSEDAIDSGIADAETMNLIAKELMKMRDKEISNKTDLQRAFDAYKEKNPETETTPPPTNTPPKTDEEPEWAKNLRERYEREDRERADRDLRERIEGRLKQEGCQNAGILKSTLKGFVLGKDEKEDDAVARLKTEYNESYKEVFGDGGQPGFGGNAFPDAKTATDHKNEFLRKQGLLPPKDK